MEEATEAATPIDQSAAIARPRKRVALMAVGIAAAFVAFAGDRMHHAAVDAQAPVVSPLWILPFATLLAAIAIMPFAAKHWWERHYAKVAIALGAIVAVYYCVALTQTNAVGEHLGRRAIAGSLAEYISFILLIGSLFIVSGGVLVHVRCRATPIANTSLLLAGAVLANIFGTTGASMLLIRPFLRLNAGRVRAYHVVFFIFIVSNVGGSLTPIGDPPLFLGYLQGVPFWWVLQHCWPFWLLMNCGLLAIFLVIDRTNKRGTMPSSEAGQKISLEGSANLLLIALIIGGVLLHDSISGLLKRSIHFALPVRELAMIAASVGSLLLTPRRVHVANAFNYAPLREVAVLFIGIFLTMAPALSYLEHENAKPIAERRIVVTSPGDFYFATGALSAALDNAPTYLAFFESKLAQVAAPSSEGRVDALLNDEMHTRGLVAISMGAVLFGAMTYIGNGPNFMVKAIAENAGVPMPGFFGYLLKYALPALLPLLILAWAVFLR